MRTHAAIAAPTTATTEPRRSFWMYVPPPPLFVATFLAGMLVGRQVYPAVVPAAVAPVAWGLGIVALGAAGGLLASACLLFLRRRTTIIPFGAARSLVTAGPYRVTRNPMYLGLVTAYVGAALIANAVWPLVLLALPVWILQRKVIPFEERTLAQIFGDDYRAYQQRVRRWI